MNDASTFTISHGSPGTLLLQWSAGTPPFQLEKRDDLNAGTMWQPFGNPTMARSKQVAASGSQGYFRLREQVEMHLDAIVTDGETQLIWDVPDME